VDISATPTSEKSMKDALLAAARALDHGRWEEARERLRPAIGSLGNCLSLN